MLEVVVVLLRLLRTELAQHADGGGRGVEDVHPQPLGDPPGTTRIRVGGHALIHHAGGPQRQRAVHDVGVAGDPADVGETPVGVLGMDVLVVLGRPGDVGQVAAGAVLATLGPAGGTAGVHQKQGRFGRHGHRLDQLPAIVAQLVDEEVPAVVHGAPLSCTGRGAAAKPAPCRPPHPAHGRSPPPRRPWPCGRSARRCGSSRPSSPECGLRVGDSASHAAPLKPPNTSSG